MFHVDSGRHSDNELSFDSAASEKVVRMSVSHRKRHSSADEFTLLWQVHYVDHTSTTWMSVQVATVMAAIALIAAAAQIDPSHSTDDANVQSCV